MADVEISFFDERKLPAVITPAAPDLDAAAWCAGNKTFIRSLLSEHGAVLLRGFQTGGAASFERVLINATSDKSVVYRDKATPRTHLTGNVFSSTDYDPARTIFPHNENSYCTSWPLYVAFYAEVPPRADGATPLVDCRKVYQQIPELVRKRFEALGVLYCRVHGHGLGMSWKDSYSVSTVEELQRYCRDNVMDLTVQPDGVARVKYRRWASITHPVTSEKAWFNHGVFFNVSALEPELKEFFLSCYDETELPYNTFYGNGARIEPEIIEQLHAIYMRNLTRFDYRQGDVLIVDNMLVAHGRETYSGDRKICVSMTEQVWAKDIPECREYVATGAFSADARESGRLA